MPDDSSELVTVDVQNVGGIDETTVQFQPGVTVLAGRNATNRTSFLQSIMAAMGSENVSLKGDADEGRVELTYGGGTYTRTLKRNGGSIVTGGDPYLDDPELADLFAFLLESNEARRAVARGDDLRELILRPVDTEAIKSEISRLEGRKREIDEQLSELDTFDQRLPGLEAEREQLESDIEAREAQLEGVRTDIDDLDASLESQQDDDRQEVLDDLRAARSDLEDVRFRIETERESLSSLREERESLADQLDDLPDASADVDELNRRIESLREERQAVTSEMNQLQNIVRFNEDMLEGTNAEVARALRDEDDGGSLTDELLGDSREIVCWTCGSVVERSSIEDTLERLRSLRTEKVEERSELKAELDDLSEKKRAIETTKRDRERLDRDLRRTTEEIDRREDALESLQEERDDLEERVENLETAVEEQEPDEDVQRLVDLHRQANELETDIDRMTKRREEVESQVADLEARLAERDELEAEREGIQEELVDLRTRIDTIERDAIEAFNDHMEAVLDRLDYANVERVWIERTEREAREGRRKVTRGRFDLHIVRRSESGTAYEDTIDHLSESEREVTGLVFALAGYLVHEVYEEVPFMLLDSLEAVDSDRIASLVEYLGEHADNLVVALLPEDASALDDRYERVAEI